MQKFKFILAIAITLALIVLLDRSWEIGGTRIPPLGKFLDPFHGFWQNNEPSDVFTTQEITIPGLKEPVEVVFDSMLIPHIYAQNDHDVYYTQGYVTAKFRLWQMEFQTHAAAGRVSELIGPGKDNAVLNYDRGQRRQGMVLAAQRALESMENDPIARDIVQAYTDGINAYIESLRYKDLPLEYKLMDYKPEPWTNLKSALLLKSMAQTLNSFSKDVDMTNALKLFGKDVVALLYPDREPVEDPIVDKPGAWKFANTITLDTIPLAIPDELLRMQAPGNQDPSIGSNNWAVHGSKTATGAPILCNDPHLTISLPSIWYAIHLNTPTVNVMGASLPGTPGVIIGFNDSIAWGVTNAQRDLVDWYSIEFDNGKKERYKLDSGWMNVERVVEKYAPRGAAIFYDTILMTTWGPILYDDSYRDGHQLKHYAYRWISHDKSEELLTFYKLNRAENHTDYMRALDHFSSPAQNFVFASVSGDIAIRIQGKFPVRRPLEGKFLLDGTTSSSGWQAYIPFDQNVMDKNPERGFVSSANQYPVDATYPYYVTSTSFEAYRNRRINQVLGERDSITITDMMNLQNDNYNLKAAESLPLFLLALDTTTLTPDERIAYDVLRKWDYINNVDSEGASYYEAWWDKLYPMIWDEMRTEEIRLATPTTWNTIHLMRTNPELTFFDIQETSEKETAPDLLRKAFKESVAAIKTWQAEHNTTQVRWADYKDTYIEHLARLPQFSYHVQHGGNHDIVNASSRRHGPSWRMIVSLEKNNLKAFGIYPGGQSGNPGSKYYNNMTALWSTGKYATLPFTQKASDIPSPLFTLALTPSK